jgi:hypothetical protein
MAKTISPGWTRQTRRATRVVAVLLTVIGGVQVLGGLTLALTGRGVGIPLAGVALGAVLLVLAVVLIRVDRQPTAPAPVEIWRNQRQSRSATWDILDEMREAATGELPVVQPEAPPRARRSARRPPG